MDFLQNSGLYIVNGRMGIDNYTCISAKGCSLVDYCIVSEEEMERVEDFQVITMSNCLNEMRLHGEVRRVCDHSLIMWNLKPEGPSDWVERKGFWEKGKRNELVLEGEEDRIKTRAVGFEVSSIIQGELDKRYQEVVGLIKSGLKEVKMGRMRKNK